ncbi:hypothetical protein HanPI659440_Chr04g0171701 [Helianthus annuus]|nr:hypothetical protein HanPI659440_Chr04g0171701 [Helianthus annuus]
MPLAVTTLFKGADTPIGISNFGSSFLIKSTRNLVSDENFAFSTFETVDFTRCSSPKLSSFTFNFKLYFSYGTLLIISINLSSSCSFM